MKKLLLIVSLMIGAVGVYAADTETPTPSPTATPTITPALSLPVAYNTGNAQKGSIWIGGSNFFKSDFVSMLGSSASTTEAYYVTATAIPGVGVVAIPNGITVAASLLTPLDVKSGAIGNFKVYAVGKLTGVATVGGTLNVAWAMQSRFDSLTNTTQYQGIASAVLDTRAGSRMVIVDMPLNTQTGVAIPKSLQPFRYVTLKTQYNGLGAGIFELYGLLIQYDRWTGTGR